MPVYKNSFRAGKFIEQIIVDDKDAVIGTIRIKPSSVLWKASNARQFHSVPLRKFIDWITDDSTKATKTKS